MFLHYYDGLFRGNPPRDENEDDENERSSEKSKSCPGAGILFVIMLYLVPIGLLIGFGLLVSGILHWFGLTKALR